MPNLPLEKIGIDRAEEAQSVINRAPAFSLNTEGLLYDPKAAIRDLEALPPGCSADQKYFFFIMGFTLTGESKPYQGQARTSRVLLMEKVLVET